MDRCADCADAELHLDADEFALLILRDGRVAWLTQWSKVRAYEVLGERPKAVTIMERWLLRDAEQPSPSSEVQTL